MIKSYISNLTSNRGNYICVEINGNYLILRTGYVNRLVRFDLLSQKFMSFL